jgi:hypothetical protein
VSKRILAGKIHRGKPFVDDNTFVADQTVFSQASAGENAKTERLELSWPHAYERDDRRPFVGRRQTSIERYLCA